mmetsp:Transcript_10312/g.11372  ORF Transcript_10312/g.11372 Transcript_10312/m.11372 type:complete len:205 (-) Transcript_10312:103-717(-)|eukprot:CAMPEP_0168513918 /NCGR_PEP_ID=MMETSP0405-20121227/3774_1 /TAXON_ID=498012 /ORGANISM="Trichosphaerium sp, Strain Am-I-7 wt" /LENGTH=204 /DNA_ID=CAMNT_0008532893 /DNA_START=43 /DNA_END=657 /DNA_ORIENTATION=+
MVEAAAKHHFIIVGIEFVVLVILIVALSVQWWYTASDDDGRDVFFDRPKLGLLEACSDCRSYESLRDAHALSNDTSRQLDAIADVRTGGLTAFALTFGSALLTLISMVFHTLKGLKKFCIKPSNCCNQILYGMFENTSITAMILILVAWIVWVAIFPYGDVDISGVGPGLPLAIISFVILVAIIIYECLTTRKDLDDDEYYPDS